MSLQNRVARQKSKDRVLCYVPGCKSRSQKNLELSFHKFPQPGSRHVFVVNAFGGSEKVDQCAAWKNKLRIKGNIPARAKICSLHFVAKDFGLYLGNSKSVKLRRNAVPSINLPQTSIPGKQINEDLKNGRMNRLLNRREVKAKQKEKKEVVRCDPKQVAMTHDNHETSNQESVVEICCEPVSETLNEAIDKICTVSNVIGGVDVHDLIKAQHETSSDIGVQFNSGFLTFGLTNFIQTDENLNCATELDSMKLLNTIVKAVDIAVKDKNTNMKQNSSQFSFRKAAWNFKEILDISKDIKPPGWVVVANKTRLSFMEVVLGHHGPANLRKQLVLDQGLEAVAYVGDEKIEEGLFPFKLSKMKSSRELYVCLKLFAKAILDISRDIKPSGWVVVANKTRLSFMEVALGHHGPATLAKQLVLDQGLEAVAYVGSEKIAEGLFPFKLSKIKSSRELYVCLKLFANCGVCQGNKNFKRIKRSSEKNESDYWKDTNCHKIYDRSLKRPENCCDACLQLNQLLPKKINNTYLSLSQPLISKSKIKNHNITNAELTKMEKQKSGKRKKSETENDIKNEVEESPCIQFVSVKEEPLF